MTLAPGNYPLSGSGMHGQYFSVYSIMCNTSIQFSAYAAEKIFRYDLQSDSWACHVVTTHNVRKSHSLVRNVT